MFMKKTRAEKGYAYGMLWSFKMSVTCTFFFNITPDNCARCEGAFVGHNPNFYRALCDVWCLYSRLEKICVIKAV